MSLHGARAFWLLPCALLAQEAIAPPAIRPHGVRNAASHVPPALAAGGIARGSLFTISGVRLGPDAPASGGVSVRVATVEARTVSVGAEQIEAVMPWSAPLGPAMLTVSWRGQTSEPYALTVVESSFGIFTRNGLGWGPALDRAAQPGELIKIEGTGLGSGKTGDIELFVGGRRAVGVTAARDKESGRDEIRFRVPKDAPPGCWVPVQVRTPMGMVSNTATMAIAQRGRPCPESENWLLRQLGSTGRRALILLIHSKIQLALGLWLEEFSNDEIDAFFRKLQAGSGPPSRFEMLPPAGTCTSYAETIRIGALVSGISLARALGGRVLDAGEHLMLSGPNGEREIGRAPRGEKYGGQVGGRAIGLGKPSPLFLAPGDYEIRGSGGRDVGSVRAAVRIPLPVAWVNAGEITSVDRARGAWLRWSGAAKEDSIAVVAINLDLSTGATGICLCVPAPGASEFSIPAEALANFPSAPVAGLSSLLGLIAIGGKPQTFQASGLDGGVAGWAVVSAKSVAFR